MSFQHLSELAISESGFVFDPHTGATFTLNLTALSIVEALKRGATPGQLTSHVQAEYAEVPASVQDDIETFLRELRQQGLLGDDASEQRGTS